MSSKSRRGPIAAEDLMAELEADPEFVARRDEKRRRLERLWAKQHKAEAPLRKELQALGFEVESAWELYKYKPYPEALPVLFEHLGRPYPDRIREGIARALGIREARPEWPRLVELYKAEPHGTGAKVGLAASIAAIADKKVLDELIALAHNRKLGSTRIFFISTLARFRMWDVIEQLAADPELHIEAEIRLKARARRLAKAQAAKK